MAANHGAGFDPTVRDAKPIKLGLSDKPVRSEDVSKSRMKRTGVTSVTVAGNGLVDTSVT